MNGTRWVSTNDAARVTGISAYILRRGVQLGRFDCIYSGGNGLRKGRMLFDLKQLILMLENEQKEHEKDEV